MSEMFRCGDSEALVDYLYDDADSARRDVVAAHIAVCGSCAEEVAALGSTKEKLAAWQVPHVALGFRLPNDTAPTVVRPVFGGGGKPAWWRQPLPAWAQAAAAALIFASGLAAGLSRGATPAAAPARDAVTASAAQTASAAPAAPAVPAALAAPAASVVPVSVPPAATVADRVTTHDLAAVEQRLRAEMAQVHTSAPLARTDAAVLQQVRALIAESEQRQRNDVSVRLAQAVRTVEKQRQVDMNQVQWTMGQLQELTGAAVRDQGTKVEYLLKSASLRR